MQTFTARQGFKADRPQPLDGPGKAKGLGGLPRNQTIVAVIGAGGILAFVVARKKGGTASSSQPSTATATPAVDTSSTDMTAFLDETLAGFMRAIDDRLSSTQPAAPITGPGDVFAPNDPTLTLTPEMTDPYTPRATSGLYVATPAPMLDQHPSPVSVATQPAAVYSQPSTPDAVSHTIAGTGMSDPGWLATIDANITASPSQNTPGNQEFLDHIDDSRPWGTWTPNGYVR